MRKGVLVLLYKRVDWTELGNWRLLTLLTTDFEWVLGPGSLAGAYSCVRVNGFLSGAVEQAGGNWENWEARLALVRSRLGVWSRRRLLLMGKVVVFMSVLLPLLLHLAYVFPVPARAKLAQMRAVFRFLWGGRYYLAGFFRHLVALTHVVPQADVNSPAYEAVARFFHQCPPSASRAEALDHRLSLSPGGVFLWGARWSQVGQSVDF
ncbi:hypothetical protein AAFF_G00126140 [Aldrovandia affinis]|uniref:Uncharacterized protein n=1 Tax=Aldrovandia affinis TaxID=143900 RepID=A0AAD7W9V6_9TELE|nr:hypothetical protein AAFF_G00126140 [Aldrovandia affinis]